MELYSSNENYKLYHGNMLDMLEIIQPNTIDSIVTDPPYGLTSITKRFGKENSAECQYGKDGSFQRLSKGFMGKEWDGSGIEYNIDAWGKCYEVLKPGGYLLAFGGSRTFHRIACAIEDAGFEIRDTIMWIYGSGFPKSMSLDKAIEGKLTTGSGNKKDFYKCNGVLEESKGKGYTSMKKTNVEQEYRNTNYQSKGQIKLEPTTDLAKEYYGWGTALKPSYEPIIVARKPFKGSLVDNVIEYGVGGINIDECRIETNGELIDNHITKGIPFMRNTKDYQQVERSKSSLGRFPANTILTYDETDYDEVCGGFPDTKNSKRTSKYNKDTEYTNTYTPPKAIYTENNTYGDSGSASRYFMNCKYTGKDEEFKRYIYTSKASKKDRDEGLEDFEEITAGERTNRKEGSAGINAYAGVTGKARNIHPTVKPCELMQYLVRLVSPEGATILDPFNGSGSTGKAVMYENKERNKNYKYIGIELTEEYLPISKARIEYLIDADIKEEKQNIPEGQISIFDLESEKL